MATVTDRPARRHPLLNDPVWLADEYVGQGKSLAAIGASIGMSSTSVHRAMRRLGLETRTRHKLDPAAQERLQDIDWLGKRWLFDHATLAELASEIGAAPSTIWLVLVDHDLADRAVTARTRSKMRQSAKSRPPVTPQSAVRRRQAQQARRARERLEQRIFNIASLVVLLKRDEIERADRLRHQEAEQHQRNTHGVAHAMWCDILAWSVSLTGEWDPFAPRPRVVIQKVYRFGPRAQTPKA